LTKALKLLIFNLGLLLVSLKKIVFKKKYLLLELDPFEAEFYHLPEFVPYFEKDQKKFDHEGFNWDLSLKAMRTLVSEEDCPEYKLYKLFIRKWSLYQKLTDTTQAEEWNDCEKTIEKILAIDLLDPSAYLNLGMVSRTQGKFHKARQSFLKGLEIVKYKTPFLSGLAKTYESIGNFEDAIYHWSQVIELSKKNLEETLANDILETAFKEATAKLIEKKVYKAKHDKASSQDLEPDLYHEKLMRKIFQKHFNDKETLTKLGIKLVHHKLNKLAVKVLERVYQLTESETNQTLVKA
jgi:tetratricopeptide (TPR) repeat protein